MTTETKKRRKAPAKSTALTVPEAQPLPVQQIVVKAAPVPLGDLEKVLIEGDLAKLTPDERIKYYAHICDRVGLEPSTKPFNYLQLNGKLVLYATRNCTDQLCKIYKLSTSIAEMKREDDLMLVRARVSTPEGRANEALGAVSLKGLSGEALANAMMKAETKAKRRAVLSLCGLSFMDETEAETLVPASQLGAAAVANMNARFVPSVRADDPPLKGIAAAQVKDQRSVDKMNRSEEVPDKQLIQTGEEREEPEQELLPAEKSEKPKARNSAGVLYPAPPENVIAMLKQGRYVPWLNWIETEGFWDEFKPEGLPAFIKDFGAAIKMVRNYGGSHWKRCKIAFEQGGEDLQD